uniref:Uncharacterized protein n=1 Tax=Anguilla anguilla TaxID=7936 RepID=A0A0E9WNU7_ANGAN
MTERRGIFHTLFILCQIHRKWYIIVLDHWMDYYGLYFSYNCI